MEESRITETHKKSAFTAKNQYEYQRLVFEKPYFIPMELQEDKEELTFTYQIGEKKPLAKIHEEDSSVVLLVLIQIDALKEALQEYSFSMAPDNLYYDRNRLVYIKTRDSNSKGNGLEEKEFLENYKALVGFSLQNKYSYEDYQQGGILLLSKNPLQNKIREAKNSEEIKCILLEEYQRIELERKENKMLLNRSSFFIMKISIIFLVIICSIFLSFTGYFVLKVNPYQEAVIKASNAYLEQNYVGCIDALKKIKVSDMQTHQKYILANSYIRSESLTQEQKNNIIETISLKEKSIRLDYWIYLGRGEITQAVDIAMQQSDNELLLYAYMKQKAAIETSNTLTGEEKAKQLEDINTKMEPLMEQYKTEEK